MFHHRRRYVGGGNAEVIMMATAVGIAVLSVIGGIICVIVYW